MADEGVGSRDLVEKIESEGFVEVMFTRSMSEATDCRSLLLNRQIPAEVESDPKVSSQCGVAVLVPADRLIEASELLAVRAQDNEDLDDDSDEVDDLDDDEDFDDDGIPDDDDFDDDFDDELGDEDNFEDDDDY